MFVYGSLSCLLVQCADYKLQMSTKIFVGNLPHGSTSDDIRPLFEQYGTITECAVLGSFAFVVSYV